MSNVVYTPTSQCVEVDCADSPIGNGMCRKHYNRAWQIKNRDRRNARVKERLALDPEFLNYRRNLVANKERERRAQKAKTEVVKVTKEEYNSILLSYNNSCWICEQPLTAVFWDHVQPLAKGGAHKKENLRPACNPCNVRKNSLWPFTDKMKEKIANEVRLLNCIGGDA